MRSVGTRIQTTSTAQELSPGSYHQQKYKLGGVINNMETLRTDPSRNSITYVNEVHQSGMRSEDSSALLSENNNLRDLTHRLMDEHSKSLAAVEAKLQTITIENQRLKEQLDSKNRELEKQIAIVSQLRTELGDIQRNRMAPQQLKISDYERKLYICTSEIERLNKVMTEKSLEWKQSVERMRQLEKEKAEMMSGLYGQLDLKVKLTEYENRVSILVQEIERLNLLCKSQQQHAQLAQKNSRVSESRMLQLMSDINELKHKVGQLTLSNDNYKRKESQLNEGIRLATQKEQLIVSLSKEVDSLTARNSMLSSKLQESEVVISNLQRQSGQASKIGNQLHEAKTRLTESENRITILSHEIERLNVLLQTKAAEMSLLVKHSGTMDRLEGSVHNLEAQNSQLRAHNATLVERAKTNEQQSQVLRLRSEKSNEKIEQLCLRIIQLENEVQAASEKQKTLTNFSVSRKHYEEKLSILSHEIERLNLLVESKAHNICALESQIRNSKTESMRLENLMHESNQRLLEEKEVSRKVEHYENRLALLVKEIERLNSRQHNAKLKESSFVNAENRAALVQRQLQSQKQQVQNYEQQQLVFQCSLNKLTKEFDRKSEEATKLERDNARLQEIVDKVFFQQKHTGEADRLLSILTSWYQQVRLWRSTLQGDPNGDSKYLQIEHLLEALQIEVSSLNIRLASTSVEMQNLRQTHRQHQTNNSSSYLRVSH